MVEKRDKYLPHASAYRLQHGILYEPLNYYPRQQVISGNRTLCLSGASPGQKMWGGHWICMASAQSINTKLGRLHSTYPAWQDLVTR